MKSWDPQLFLEYAPAGISSGTIQAAIASAAALNDPKLPPVFTLNHIAALSGVPYAFLRDVVRRAPAANPYRVFKLKKESAGGLKRFRWIAAPNPLLLKVQQWINSHILQALPVHNASYAYRSGRSAYDAAKLHRNARWLIKVDVTNFFDSILEPKVYQVFCEAGYQPLIAFELSRICTRIRTSDRTILDPVSADADKRNYPIHAYTNKLIGHLPQGAASSPVLANLVMKELDERLAKLAKEQGFRYSRYADDIAFSTTSRSCNMSVANSVKKLIFSELRAQGLKPNPIKCRVRGPGARKIVLGLLVDGPTPRLTKEFRDNLTLHIRHLELEGPTSHAAARGFDSVIGLRNHIEGLLSYAARIDFTFVRECRRRFSRIAWPVFDSVDISDL